MKNIWIKYKIIINYKIKMIKENNKIINNNNNKINYKINKIIIIY